MWWTQCPTSALGSGMPSDFRPRLIGRQVLPRVVRAKRSSRGDRDDDSVRVLRIEQDRVQAHPAGARLPARARAMAAQAGQLRPGLAAVGRAEEGRVLDAGIDGVGVRRRWLQMPDACELPRVRRAVVPLVRSGNAVVDELVSDGLPGLAAVVGALDELPEPGARLRQVDAVRIGRRGLGMVDLPAREVRATYVPSLALSVRRENEGSFACPDENPYAAHPCSPPSGPILFRLRRAAPCGRAPTGAGPRNVRPRLGRHPSGRATAAPRRRQRAARPSSRSRAA